MVVPPQRQATVTLTMGGTVHATTLLPGDYVKKGSVVVSLENPDFITLQQTYLDAHAQTEYLEDVYKGQEQGGIKAIGELIQGLREKVFFPVRHHRLYISVRYIEK